MDLVGKGIYPTGTGANAKYKTEIGTSTKIFSLPLPFKIQQCCLVKK